MANATRVLFVSGEVKPFAEVSSTAELVRTLPEQLQEAGDYETRIMMPRYGTISERKNRLHEVIRLSGTEVSTGDGTETLKVKVASIPGIRLQVYFMDSKQFFKRKGIYADRKTKAVYEDNVERAFFFARSVLETIKKLRWEPDIVHLFGWMAAPMALLLQTEYAEDEVFAKAKVVYTPDAAGLEVSLTEEQISALDLPDELAPGALQNLAVQHAHLVALPDALDAAFEGATFSTDADTITEDVTTLYDQVLGVPA